MSDLVTAKEKPVVAADASWGSLGDSLGSALESCGVSRATLGTAVILGAALLTGCSPQQSSYWTGNYTKLPPPPATARMQLGVSTEDDGTVFINYVTWNKDSARFERKDIHYTTTSLAPGTFSQAGGYEQEIHDGEVLYGGAIVDQAAGKILFADGKYIEGKTGNIYAESGKLIKEYGAHQGN